MNNLRFIGQEGLNERLWEKARGMLGHLASVVYKDNTIPLLNDSAEESRLLRLNCLHTLSDWIWTGKSFRWERVATEN